MKGSKIKKFFLNPWTVGIGVAVFSSFLTIVVDFVRGEKILSTFITIIHWVWNTILSFLSFELKVWWVLIGIVIIALGLFIYSGFLDQKSSPPLFTNYKQDTILGLKWKWEWIKNYSGKYEISNLHPICEHCDTPLTGDTSYYGGLICLRCGFRKTSIPDIDNVKMLIADNVRRRYFEQEEN